MNITSVLFLRHNETRNKEQGEATKELDQVGEFSALSRPRQALSLSLSLPLSRSLASFRS